VVAGLGELVEKTAEMLEAEAVIFAGTVVAKLGAFREDSFG
jgi:hypothetical protein